MNERTVNVTSFFQRSLGKDVGEAALEAVGALYPNVGGYSSIHSEVSDLDSKFDIRIIQIDPLDDAIVSKIEEFLEKSKDATVFHSPKWLQAIAKGTGHSASALLARHRDEILGYLPFSVIHSPIFGRLLASTGFAVGGGLLIADSCGEHANEVTSAVFAAAEEMAMRLHCPTIEMRGGALPIGLDSWSVRTHSHSGFISSLAADDEAQLLAIPRKQRAEVRKALGQTMNITVGSSTCDRSAHYAVYAESVRNLGTPVFPRSLFDAVLDIFGENADILTVWYEDQPVASVLSLYFREAVMPYWGGGTHAARVLRANDRMYYELMCHARRRGCAQFDFGRSKTGSGAYAFKRNWGFDAEPLAYSDWTAPDTPKRDADPTSAKHSAQIAIWKRLPLPLANFLGPWIARGLG